jgi:hypothetical protein
MANKLYTNLSLISDGYQCHPTGIILKRGGGYYTNSSLDDLIEFLREDGICIVSIPIL